MPNTSFATRRQTNKTKLTAFLSSHDQSDWMRMRISLEEVTSAAPLRSNVVSRRMTRIASSPAALFLPAVDTGTVNRVAAASSSDEAKPSAVVPTKRSRSTATTPPPVASLSRAESDSVVAASQGVRIPVTAGAAAAAAAGMFAPVAAPSSAAAAASPASSSRASPKPAAKRPDYYQRQNEEIKSLQQQVRVFEMRNQSVREDNRRLDALLSHARLLASLQEASAQQQQQHDNQDETTGDSWDV